MQSGDPIRQLFARQQRRVLAVLSVIVVLYLAFDLFSVFAPELMGASVIAGSPWSLGVVLAFSLAMFAAGAAVWYVYAANRNAEHAERLRAEAQQRELQQ